MLKEEKIDFIKDFLKRHHLIKKFSYDQLLNDVGELNMFYDKENSFVIKANLINLKRGRKKIQVFYIGKKILNTYTKEELFYLFSEVRLFVCYIRELRLLKQIEEEIIEKDIFINSLETKFTDFN